MRVGFIGLGRMGRPMAINLVRAGHEVTVHNRSRAAVEALGALGARAAASPAAVAAEVEALFTCLPGPADLDAVYLGPDGAAQGARPGQVFVDTSTVDPMTSRRIGDALRARGVEFLDAPVSGGPKGAEAGTLSVMVGGAPEAVARARPLLEVLGKSIFHLGPSGSDSTAKVCNQVLIGVGHVLVGEVMVLGAKAGLDPRALYEVLRVSSGRSATLERDVPGFILPGTFEPAFTMDGMYKDLECAARTAKESGVRLLLAAVAQQCYEEARGLGLGQKDPAGVILPMEAIARTEVRDRKDSTA